MLNIGKYRDEILKYFKPDQISAACLIAVIRAGKMGWSTP